MSTETALYDVAQALLELNQARARADRDPVTAILGGTWHASKSERHARRTPYILRSGFVLVFLWSTRARPAFIAAADYVIALANQVDSDPSLVGEYRVLRGDGLLVDCGRCNSGVFHGIALPRYSANPAEHVR